MPVSFVWDHSSRGTPASSFMLCAYLMINFGWLRETTWTLQILQQGAGAYIVELAQKVGAMSAVCALLHYIWKLHIFGNGCGYKRKSKESISHRKKKELTRINEEYKSYETSSLYSSFSFNNSEASLFQTANYFEDLKFGLRFNRGLSGPKSVSVSCFESESVPIPDWTIRSKFWT